MALQIEWFGIAEAVAVDGQGQLTLVNFSPIAILQPAFPSKVSFHVVTLISDDQTPVAALVEGAVLRYRLEIVSPDGEVAALASDEITVGPALDRRLAYRFQAIVGIEFLASKPGPYDLRADLAVVNSTAQVTATRQLPILERSDGGSQPSLRAAT